MGDFHELQTVESIVHIGKEMTDKERLKDILNPPSCRNCRFGITTISGVTCVARDFAVLITKNLNDRCRRWKRNDR